MNAHRSIGIAFISALAMPPVDLVHLAAELGCGHVSLGLAPMTANPQGFPVWLLREDAALRQATRAALAKTGVALAVGEAFLIRSGVDIADSAADMALFAELGCERVNGLALDPDAQRSADQLDRFVGMAEAHGLHATLEFMPGMPVGSLASALKQVERLGTDHLSLVLDCMHFMRSGGAPEQLAACPPGSIAEVQLCDVPLAGGAMSYGAEALHHRLLPGEGELPLAAILAGVSSDTPVTLEVPMLARAEAGVPIRETLARAVELARTMLQEVVNPG